MRRYTKYVGIVLSMGLLIILGGWSLSDGDFLQFKELVANGSNWIRIVPPGNIVTDRTCQLVDGPAPIPDSCVGDGVDGGGGSGSPGGADTTVQFNDGGNFGGDAELTWNKTSNVLANLGTLELGNASDTTLSRPAAGRLQIEGVDAATAAGIGLAKTNQTVQAASYLIALTHALQGGL